MYNSDPPSHMHLNVWQQWAFRIEQRLQEQEDTIKQLQLELEKLRQQQLRETAPTPTLHVDKIEYRFDQLKVETLEGSLQIGLSTSNPEQLPLMIEDIMMQQKSENAAAFSAPNQSYHGHSMSAQGQQPISKMSKQHNIYKNNNSKLAYLQEKFSALRDKEAGQTALQKDDQQQEQANVTNVLNKHLSGQPDILKSDLAMQHVADACLQMMRNELHDKFVQYIHRQSSLLKTEINDEHRRLIIEDIERQLPARIHYYAHEQQARNHSDAEQLINHVLQLTRDDVESAIDQYIYQLSIQPKEEHS